MIPLITSSSSRSASRNVPSGSATNSFCGATNEASGVGEFVAVTEAGSGSAFLMLRSRTVSASLLHSSASDLLTDEDYRLPDRRDRPF